MILNVPIFKITKLKIKKLYWWNEIDDVVHDGETLKIGKHSNEEEGNDSSGDLRMEAMKEDDEDKDELNEELEQMKIWRK